MNTTDNLLAYLENADRTALSRYKVTQLKGRITDYREYMDYLIRKSGRRRLDLFRLAGVHESYGYKLLNGEIRTGDRDRLLRILISLHTTLGECQRALKLHMTAILSPYSPRDAVLIYALCHRIYDLDWIDDRLIEAGERALQ